MAVLLFHDIEVGMVRAICFIAFLLFPLTHAQAQPLPRELGPLHLGMTKAEASEAIGGFRFCIADINPATPTCHTNNADGEWSVAFSAGKVSSIQLVVNNVDRLSILKPVYARYGNPRSFDTSALTSYAVKTEYWWGGGDTKSMTSYRLVVSWLDGRNHNGMPLPYTTSIVVLSEPITR